MPGRPLTGLVREALRRRAVHDIGDDASELDGLVAYLESGGTLSALADEMTRDLGVAVSRSLLSYVAQRLEDDAPARLTAARRAGAAAHVETAMQIVDDADTSRRETVQHAKMRSDVRLWIAERTDSANFGASTKVTGSLTVGQLHLDALRARPTVRPADPAAAIAASVVPFAVIESTSVAADDAHTGKSGSGES